MIYLDDHADTLPIGLHGTPFEEVYRAVRSVAAQVWATDPEIYRAGMAWGWYATHKPDALVAFRDVVVSALISAQAPMIKATQTNAELVEYLRQWREYRPTFPQLQSLYLLFGAVIDIQPISDPESQAVLPVDNTRLAFYLRIESVDPERPLSLSDAITIAERATPIGSRPYAYYVQESRVTVPVALAPTGVTLWVENDTVASDPPPLPVYGIPMGGMMSPTGHSTYYVKELPEQITVDNITLSGFMIPTASLEEYFGNDQLEPESITINNDDVIIPLYDFDVPVTDTSKLYGAIRLNGTGTGNIPGDDDISFNDLDILRQMGLVSLIYNGNHQLCLKFSCAGTGITFTGSMDSALIIAAIKQQMTVDNIGLQGIVGPMGGIMTEYVPLNIITLYMVQSNKDCQIAVTNASTPESRYCYQLYTSDTIQTSQTQFIPDLSKEYIRGSYDNQTGEWRDSSSKYNVQDMPSTTGDDITLTQVLSDGKLWLGSNISVGSTTFIAFSVALFRVVDKS